MPKLMNEEMNSIKKDVLKLIAEQKDASLVKPRFTQNPAARSGWLIFFFSDDATAEWIKGQSYWGDKGCSVVGTDEFPQENLVLGHFRYSFEDQTDLILQVIEGQNDINTADWRVVNRKNDGSLVILTLQVDDASLEKLKESDFHVHYGYGQLVKLKPVSGGGKRVDKEQSCNFPRDEPIIVTASDEPSEPENTETLAVAMSEVSVNPDTADGSGPSAVVESATGGPSHTDTAMNEAGKETDPPVTTSTPKDKKDGKRSSNPPAQPSGKQSGRKLRPPKKM